MSGRLQEAKDALDRYREERPLTLDETIAQVAEHAGPEWRDHALEAVRQAALTNDLVTVDEVHPFISEATYDLRALGGVMRTAGRRGWIRRLPNQYRPSKRPETHSRPLAVWESLIYRYEQLTFGLDR